MPGSLRCSFCLKEGFRSDKCPCRKATRRTFRPNIETAIFVNIAGKSVKAWLNPSVPETLIGKEVGDLVIGKTGSIPKKTITRKQRKLELISVIPVKISSKLGKVFTIEGQIKDNIPGKIVILGLDALQVLGFRFYIGGQEAKTRTYQSQAPKRFESKPKKRKIAARRVETVNVKEDNDDAISFLDEEERRQILEWK